MEQSPKQSLHQKWPQRVWMFSALIWKLSEDIILYLWKNTNKEITNSSIYFPFKNRYSETFVRSEEKIDAINSIVFYQQLI